MIEFEINPKYQHLQEQILDIPNWFKEKGEVIQNQRNLIMKVPFEGMEINVKSFKIPHLINRFAYRYLRPSKAKRSFQYAMKLINLGINTPEPIAYIVEKGSLLGRSYYISIQENVDMEFRAIVHTSPSDLEPLMKSFTEFIFDIHKKGVLFLDNSPGNVLIRREKNQKYTFFLVDINRMKFKSLTLNEGISNFRRLMCSPRMLDIISQNYARLTGHDYTYIFKKMVRWTTLHNQRKRIYFWEMISGNKKLIAK